MAGILDFLQTPEAQMGIGLLAAGGPSTTPMNVGQRVQMAMQGMNSQQQEKLKMKMLQSQIDENISQDAMRKQQLAMSQRQMAMQNQLLGFGNSPSPAATAAASGVMPTTPPTAGTAPMIPNGSDAPVAGMPSAPPQQGAGTLDAMSKQYGIPAEALKYDLVFNGGKGIAEMVAKRGTPNWQNVNGNLVDTNAAGFKGGLQAGMASSADGKVTAWQPDGQGGLVVGAPRGALDTFSAYKSAEANLKPFKYFNPANQREEYTTEGAIVAPMAGQRGNAQSPGYAGGDRNSANAESIRMIQSELAKPGNSPADAAAMQREIQRLQMQSGLTNAQVAQAPQAGNFAAGPSMQEATRAKFNDKMATEQGDLLTKSYTTAQDASNAMQGIQESRKAMQSGAFQGTGADAKLAVYKFGQAVGVNLDPEKVANTDYLKSTLGNGLLEKAKTLGSNPSNADASRITDIVGSIGKDPNAMKKILDWQEEMAKKSIDGHNTRVSQSESNGFKPQFDMRVKSPEGKPAAPVATMRFNPATGKIEKVQ